MTRAETVVTLVLFLVIAGLAVLTVQAWGAAIGGFLDGLRGLP